MVPSANSTGLITSVRLPWLDYLRGLFAFSVMLYHLTVWNEMDWPYGLKSLILKLGPLSVSGFYIISGYAIAYVYFNKKITLSFLFSFIIKRFFRLAPLLWVVIFCFFMMGYEITPQKLVLNLTLLFGFVAHDQYITTGSWSIGNEMVFYTLFPILMLSPKCFFSKLWCLSIFCLSLIFAIWSALYWIPNAESEALLWSRYIHPANQLWLFVSGVVLCLFRNNRVSVQYIVAIVFLALVIFILFPSNESSLYQGWTRIFLCLLLIIVVWACGLNDSKLPKVFNQVFHFLGAVSYSVYLLHSVVNHYVLQLNEMFIHTSKFNASIYITIPVSLVISGLTYRYIEKPAIVIGKRLDSRQSN